MAELTYKQLQREVTGLRNSVVKGAEAIRQEAHRTDGEAKDTGTVAETIGGMGVDTSTVAETRELSKIMAGLSKAAIAYTSAGDTTANLADAAHQQAATTHAGIQEAYTRSPVPLQGLDREWLRQE